MPRRRTSHLCSADNDDARQKQHQYHPLDKLLGDPEFADVFFGNTLNDEPLGDAKTMGGDADVDVEMSGDDGHDGLNGRVNDPHRLPNRTLTFEGNLININDLILRQLREDRDAYRYDVEWCRAQFDLEDISPAESRSYQLRILDLGHKLRDISHQTKVREAEMHNQRHFRSHSAAAYAAPAPPSYGPTASNGYSRPANHGPAFQIPSAALPRSAYRSHQTGLMNSELPPERRGPGRPPGSKNRLKDQTPAAPQSPTNNAQKAAALANAGAKRRLSTDVTVATRKSRPTASCDSCLDCFRVFAFRTSESLDITCAFGHRLKLTTSPVENGTAAVDASPTTKRPRVAVGSPLGSTTDEDGNAPVDTATGHVALYSTAAGKEEIPGQTVVTSVSKAPPKTRSISSDAAVLVGNPSTPRLPSVSSDVSMTVGSAAAPAISPVLQGGTGQTLMSDPTGPGGSAYKRLGHWMCTLCTSQKYLQQPTPKQPSEPSSWPLRDVSKIVTHYTRMHGEHNRMERCMELGSALEANLGPFRYWIQETKREKISLDEVYDAIELLKGGQLPDILRRYSTAAKNFPRD